MELLPAQRNTRIDQRHIRLTERVVQRHDGIVIFCSDAADLAGLPFGALLERQYQRAQQHGTVTLLSTRVGPDASPLVVAFVGGPVSSFDLLTRAAKAWKELAASAPREPLFATCGIEPAVGRRLLEAMTAAALAGNAPLPALKSKPQRHVTIERITLVSESATIDAARTLAVDGGNHLARWLTTLPPNVLTSASYRRALQTLARRQGWEFKFFNEAALKRLGAGAFLAVARANAHRDAGIVRLRYRAANRRGVVPRLALVGKGICFDTGGINLKTHKGMYQMHEDMQGSAVAAGTLLALSELNAPYDIDCWLAITENEIGAHAFRPQEIVTAANGVTIQVVHSDAEGRMALADTLALAAREQPQLMLDFATLTGACITALTDRYSGAFTNRPDWHASIAQAGRDSGERVWPFPMDEDFDADLESSVADILQCTVDGKGDHILAARFLNRFVPAATPWIHIDLAASNRSGGLAHVPTDFTGFGVRFATQLLLDHALPGTPKQATGLLATGKLARRRK